MPVDLTQLNKELDQKLPLYLSSKEKLENNNSPKKSFSNTPKGKILEDFFEDKNKFLQIIDILIGKTLISAVTHCWIDYGKGYKAVIIALLKYLQVQGYYIGNQKLSNANIIEISLNTFGVEIRIDHIKHIKYKDVDVSYIPPAISLNQGLLKP